MLLSEHLFNFCHYWHIYALVVQESVPFTFIMMDAMGEPLVVTLYNLSPGRGVIIGKIGSNRVVGINAQMFKKIWIWEGRVKRKFLTFDMSMFEN